MTKQIKGTINSIFNHEIPNNCNIYLNICRELNGITSYRGSRYTLVKSRKFSNLKTFPIPFLLEFENSEINHSNYYLEVVIEKDNQIICKNELNDQIGKEGRFRHYIDIYLDTKCFENYSVQTA